MFNLLNESRNAFAFLKCTSKHCDKIDIGIYSFSKISTNRILYESICRIQPRLAANSHKILSLDISSLIFSEKKNNEKIFKSRKENPQKPTQLSSKSHPRHLVGKRTAQKTPS